LRITLTSALNLRNLLDQLLKEAMRRLPPAADLMLRCLPLEYTSHFASCLFSGVDYTYEDCSANATTIAPNGMNVKNTGGQDRTVSHDQSG
jgi:hypothetical protein